MSQGPDNQYGGGDSSFERIDADAVCEECGTVNPEGTLFCKTCGNNLRDQRTRRMSAEGAGEYQDTPAQTSRRVFVGLLTVLALLLLVWAAMPGNVQRLQDRLTRGMSEDLYPEDADPTIYWDGPISDVFDAMAEDLRDNPVTSEQIRQSDETDFSGQTSYGGKYFLRNGIRPDDPVLGSALVVESENDLYFVAILGDTEIRGIGDTETTRYPSARFVGIRSDGRFSSGHGYAQPTEDGNFVCVGRRENSDYNYEIMAFRVP
ncbi:MAG: zinc ribbon domain-containing protein [Candidatus Hydrogenedentota bacterium]